MNTETEILRIVKQIHDLVSKGSLLSHPLIVAIVGIIIGSFLTYYFGFKTQQKIHNMQGCADSLMS